MASKITMAFWLASPPVMAVWIRFTIPEFTWPIISYFLSSWLKSKSDFAPFLLIKYCLNKYIETDRIIDSSVVANGRSIYGIDANKGKQWRFGQDGFNILSDSFGMHNFYTEQTKYYWKKPYLPGDPYQSLVNEGNFDDARLYGGIHSIYDFKNNSIVTTFSNRKGIVKNLRNEIVEEFTLEYNEELNKYTSFHSYKPYIYFNLKRNYYSPNSVNIYQHDEGEPLFIYGSDDIAYLTFNATPNPNLHKIYDNIRLSMNIDGVQTLSSWTGITDENDLHTINFNTDTRFKYREGFITFPSRELKKVSRLRGKFSKNKFTFSRFANNKAVVPLSEYEFRVSNKY